MATDDVIEPPRLRGRPRIAESRAITAAIELLEGQPTAAITMDLIAERAGVSKITLYRRWPTKLLLCVEAMLVRLASSNPLDEDLPPPVAIRQHLIAMIETFAGPTGDLVRKVVGESLADREMAGMLRERFLGDRRALAIRIIERGLADGSFRAPSTAEVLHDQLYGAIWYRFLFGVGSFDRPSTLRLYETIFQPVA